jgi:predicted nucleotidyltransferase
VNVDQDKSTLSAEEILSRLAQYQVDLRAMGVRTLGLFGSHRRDTPHEASDLDILVVLEQPSFRAYMDIKWFLEGLFGRKVDVVLEDALKPRLRSRILGEVLYAPGLSPLP